jgi:hypothetical protein
MAAASRLLRRRSSLSGPDHRGNAGKPGKELPLLTIDCA